MNAEEIFETIYELSLEQSFEPLQDLYMSKETIESLIDHYSIVPNPDAKSINQLYGMKVYEDNSIPFLEFETSTQRRERLSKYFMDSFSVGLRNSPLDIIVIDPTA